MTTKELSELLSRAEHYVWEDIERVGKEDNSFSALNMCGLLLSYLYKASIDLMPQEEICEERIKVLAEIRNYAASKPEAHWNDYIYGVLGGLIKDLKIQYFNI